MFIRVICLKFRGERGNRIICFIYNTLRFEIIFLFIQHRDLQNLISVNTLGKFI